MAMTYYPSSTWGVLPSHPSSKSSQKVAPFLGFSMAAVSSKPTFSLIKTHNKKMSTLIRCQNADDQEATTALIPREQQWMFDATDFKGPDIWNTTWYPKASDHINTEKTWYIVDATDKILGRLASTIAIHIRGKNLVTYTPSVDMGAFVIVITNFMTVLPILSKSVIMRVEGTAMSIILVNAEKVAVSGKKRNQKLYRRHSGRPGGMKVETFDQLQQRIPERIVEHAVRGMLPKGRLGRALFNHLKVYKGPDHPHEAQKPVDLPIRDKRIQIQK